MKTYIVTGGAGFIGSNFVLAERKHGETRVINLDLLTYAGNLMNLQGLQGDPDYIFVQGDIRDRDLVRAFWRNIAPVQWSTLQLNPTWTAQSTAQKTSFRPMWLAPFIYWKRCGGIGEASLARRKTFFASCMFQPMRCMALCALKILPFMNILLMPPTVPTPPPRQRATIWCGLTTIHTAYPLSPRTALTTMGRGNFLRS